MKDSPASDSTVESRVLGADPWVRFDLWSSRAWDAAERASDLAMVNGPPVNADDDLDHRIVALFHATAVAKEFAEMTNPLIAVTDVRFEGGSGKAGRSDLSLDMIVDTEEQG